MSKKVKYLLISNAGVGLEKGATIEVESLHPCLVQHVRQLSEGVEVELPPSEKDEKDGEAKGKKAPVKPPVKTEGKTEKTEGVADDNT